MIETAAKSVAAETLCTIVQGDDAKPPTYDELMSNQAALLKSLLAKAARQCTNLIAKDLLQLDYTDAQLKPAEASVAAGTISVDRQPLQADIAPANAHRTSPVVGAIRSADNRIRLTRSEVEAIMGRVWEFVRGDDGHLVRWEFWGTTLYGTNISIPGHYSADWRFNERNELCIFWTTRRSVDRCILLARDGAQLVMIDAKNPDVVFAKVELK